MKKVLLLLKNLIKRTSVPRDPKNDVNSSEECFEIVFAAHAISAVMLQFNMDSVVDTIKSMPADISTCDLNTKWDILFSALKQSCEPFTGWNPIGRNGQSIQLCTAGIHSRSYSC